MDPLPILENASAAILVGKGGQAEVYKLQLKDQKCALKAFISRDFFMQELRVLRDLQGIASAPFPSIVSTVAFRKRPSIVMTCYRSSLLALKKNNSLTEMKTIDFAIDTLKAIQILH